jgi:hypothetical protein
MKLTTEDLKTIKALLEDEHTRLTEDLADVKAISAVVIPLIKIISKLEKVGK